MSKKNYRPSPKTVKEETTEAPEKNVPISTEVAEPKIVIEIHPNGSSPSGDAIENPIMEIPSMVSIVDIVRQCANGVEPNIEDADILEAMKAFKIDAKEVLCVKHWDVQNIKIITVAGKKLIWPKGRKA
jgi:hypothetical protein